MIYNVKAFGKVEKTEESEFLVVGGREDVIGYSGKSGFGGEAGAETVLG